MASVHLRDVRRTCQSGGGSAPNSVTWISERLSTTSHRTLCHNDLSLAQRISSSLHRDSARAMLRRVRLTAWRDASTILGPDDWWPAWDDPGTDIWSTECDSLPDLSDDECLTTMMATRPWVPPFSLPLPRFPCHFLPFRLLPPVQPLASSFRVFGQWFSRGPCLRSRVLPPPPLRQIRRGRRCHHRGCLAQ